jgi:hypothetical protein
MRARLPGFQEISVSRRLVPAIVLLAGLAPAVAYAQVNIDEGKTPAHIWASDCGACHKTTRGLANGRGSSELASFLSEHYTSSREEAAAVARYVLAGGGGVGTPAPVHREKPERPTASAEQPGRQAKPATRPEEAAAPGGKRKRQPREQVRPAAARGAKPEPAGREAVPHGTADRRERGAPASKPGGPKTRQAREPEPGPTTAAAAPVAPVAPPAPSEAAPAAAAEPTPAPSMQTEPAEGPPVQRDDIPD